MARVALTSGAYSARSIIANAQRCVNLYPETNPNETQPPVPVTHYPTPGMVKVFQPTVAKVRGLYRATTGAFFVASGTNVYFINFDFSQTLCGIIKAGNSQVAMMDNGIYMVLVDGTVDGYWLRLGSTVLTKIVDAAFYGATYVQYLDGYFIFNRPNTNQFYLSPPYWDGQTPMDPLDIASKTGGPDNIIGIAVVHRDIWLVGQLTTEVWYNAGGADFPFERQPGVFMDHGMLLGYSLCIADESILWLGRDRQGQCIVFKSEQYAAVRISTHPIEEEFQTYAVTNDAIGFTYQQQGHTFYVLTFPTADKTWVYDMATGQWHERTWTDENGVEHRIRANCCAPGFNKMWVGDWENGKVYHLEPDVFTDDGDPIVRRRGFPHLVNDSKRVSYKSFIADMEVGNVPVQPGPGAQLMLRYSDTRGASWSNAITLPLGGTGAYYRSLIVRRLGMARDRVFELFWSAPYKTALNGAWIEAEPAET